MGWVVTLQEVNIFFLSPRLEQPTRYRSVWSPGRVGGQRTSMWAPWTCVICPTYCLTFIKRDLPCHLECCSKRLCCLQPIAVRKAVSMKQNHIWRGLVFANFSMLEIFTVRGRDSSVCIATSYGLDGPGIESLWGRDFPHPYRPALGPTHSPIQWLPDLFPGVKQPERGADHSPPSSAKDWRKSIATHVFPLWVFVACCRERFIVRFTNIYC